MKMNTLSAAIGLALVALSGNALALGAASFTGAELSLRVSGASGQDGGIEREFRRLCVAGTLDEFTFTNQFVFFCTANATQTGLPAGSNIVVYKSSVGGSQNGIDPVANQTNVSFIDLNAIKATPSLCTSSSVAAVPALAPDTIGLPAYTLNACAATTPLTSTTPQAGFSDVEPSLFGASAAQLAVLTITSPNALVQGMPVTTNVRNALQARRNAQNAASPTGLPNLTVGSDAAADIPSISSAEATSLYTGAVSSWSTLGVSLANDQVYVARRVDSSGTQKAFDIFYVGGLASCKIPGVQGFVAANDTTTCGATAGTVGSVFAGSGSGNVVSCLNTHNSGGRGAIGILSTEFVPAASAGYRMIKVNGQASTLLNTARGTYPYWVETSYQYNNAVTTGSRQTLAQAIGAKLSDPVVVQAINTGLSANSNFGTVGVMATLPNGFAPTAAPFSEATISANPVNPYSKSVSGAPNNCQLPQAFAPAY